MCTFINRNIGWTLLRRLPSRRVSALVVPSLWIDSIEGGFFHDTTLGVDRRDGTGPSADMAPAEESRGNREVASGAAVQAAQMRGGRMSTKNAVRIHFEDVHLHQTRV